MTIGQKNDKHRILKKPDLKISVRQTFGIDTDMELDSFSKK